MDIPERLADQLSPFFFEDPEEMVVDLDDAVFRVGINDTLLDPGDDGRQLTRLLLDGLFGPFPVQGLDKGGGQRFDRFLVILVISAVLIGQGQDPGRLIAVLQGDDQEVLNLRMTCGNADPGGVIVRAIDEMGFSVFERLGPESPDFHIVDENGSVGLGDPASVPPRIAQ